MTKGYTTRIITMKNGKVIGEVLVDNTDVTVDLHHNYEPDPVTAMQTGVEPEIISTFGNIVITGKIIKWAVEQ